MSVTSLTFLRVISVSLQSYIKRDRGGNVCPDGDIVRGALLRECFVLPSNNTDNGGMILPCLLYNHHILSYWGSYNSLALTDCFASLYKQFRIGTSNNHDQP